MTNLDIATLRAVKDSGVELPPDMEALLATSRHTRPGDRVKRSNGKPCTLLLIRLGDFGNLEYVAVAETGTLVFGSQDGLVEAETGESLIAPPRDQLPMVGRVVWDDPDNSGKANDEQPAHNVQIGDMIDMGEDAGFARIVNVLGDDFVHTRDSDDGHSTTMTIIGNYLYLGGGAYYMAVPDGNPIDERINTTWLDYNDPELAAIWRKRYSPQSQP